MWQFEQQRKLLANQLLQHLLGSVHYLQVMG